MSRIYGHLLPRRRSAVCGHLSVGIRLFQDSPGRDIYQWGSVYFRIPRADSDGGDVSAQRLMMMMMMYLSSVYFGTRGSELWLFIPQMFMISSESRFSANDQRTWRMAQCIHLHHSHFAFICIEPMSSHMGSIMD